MLPLCILFLVFVPTLSACQASDTPAENGAAGGDAPERPLVGGDAGNSGDAMENALPLRTSEQTPECIVVNDHPLDRGIAEIGNAWNETEEIGICHCGEQCWESVYDRQQADACYVELVNLANNSRAGSVTIDATPVSYGRLVSDDTTPLITYRITGNSSWIEGRCWYDVASRETCYAEFIGPGGSLTWPDSYWESH